MGIDEPYENEYQKHGHCSKLLQSTRYFAKHFMSLLHLISTTLPILQRETGLGQLR